jgi:hypothetical protein
MSRRRHVTRPPGSVLLWLNPGGEVKVAERIPEYGPYWLPVWEPMQPEEAKAVIVELTKFGYYGQHIYNPRVSPDDPEVKAATTAGVDEAGLLLAQFGVDVKRAVYQLRKRREAGEA